MKLLSVRGGAYLLIGSLVAGLSAQAHAGWGHRHASVGGSSGVYAVGYGSSGAYSSYGSGGSSGYGSSGYASYSSYGSSGASYGSSGYYGSSGRPTLRQRIADHFAAKRARRAASHGSSGYYASSGGSSGYSSSGGSSGYSVSYASHGSSGGSSGTVSYGSVGASYGSVGVGHYGSTSRSYSSGNSYVRKSSVATPSTIASRVDGDAVYLTVAVPSTAKIFVNGKATTSTGSVREYVSRGLKPGSIYKFDIRAELEASDGQIIRDSRKLVVRAGDREQVQFAFAEQAKPIETAVTLNVPEGAQVFLSGNATKATGATRTFRTSKLKSGETWDDYQIEVHHEGQVKSRSVRLAAGDQLRLTFAFDEATSDKLASR